MPKGKVKEYDAKSGYGIIIDFETGHQLAAYANYINLKDGEVLKREQEVEYDVQTTRHEKWAINVRVI